MRKITNTPEGIAQALDRWDGKTTRREFLQHSGLFVFSAWTADVAPFVWHSDSAGRAATGP